MLSCIALLAFQMYDLALQFDLGQYLSHTPLKPKPDSKIIRQQELFIFAPAKFG
jgi:hypothetical protein